MRRRDLLRFGLAACLAGAAGCQDRSGNFDPYAKVSLPPFSADNLHRLLDRLLAAFEARDMPVADSLLPPLSQAELIKRCAWFPGELPPEIVALYAWRGGQEKDAWETEFPFWFRDNSFCSIERAEQEYKSMMASYGIYQETRELLQYSFPFAAFNGGWYVLPTRGQPYSASLAAPVIGVLEGIDIYYFSIETRVATCVDWVGHDSYAAGVSLPESVEMSIWQKHNPGIFGYGSR